MLQAEYSLGGDQNTKMPHKIKSARHTVVAGNRIVLPAIITDGRTGEEFIQTLRKKGYRVSDWARDILKKSAFVTTKEVIYKPVVIKGDEFSDSERSSKNIRAEAKRCGYLTPPAELAPYLREILSDEETRKTGLWWLVNMHEPINDSEGTPRIFDVSRRVDGLWLHASFDGNPTGGWFREAGFVFLLPQ